MSSITDTPLDGNTPTEDLTESLPVACTAAPQTYEEWKRLHGYARFSTQPSKHRNPYLDAYLKSNDKTDDSPSRDLLISQYAWSIPDHQIAQMICKHTNRLIEIGAGTGYWAWFLSQYGIKTRAYDVEPHFSAWAGNIWHKVEKGDVRKVARFSDRALFLSWPPLDEPMAFDALSAYRGDLLIYSGEGRDGCTANVEFFDLIDSDWTLLAKCRETNWTPIESATWIYKRA